MAALFRLSIWSLSLWASFAAGPVSALVIYRFGGEALDPPPEVDHEGVEFIQLSWTDLDPSLGGETVDLDLDTAAIQPLERDPDFNIAPGIEEHGGEHVRPNVNVEVWDGDVSSAWVAASYLCGALSKFFCVDDFGRQGTANINLGRPYLVDRVRIISGLTDPSKIVRTFRIYIAPELPWKNRSLIDHPPPYSPWVFEERDNREQIIDVPIPPQEGTTFVQVAISEHREDWEVNEIEVYAKGLVKKASYTSNILDFGQPMAWGDLRWSGRQDPKARVLIQTRAGQDDDPDLFWRSTGRGDEKISVSRTDYAKLAIGEKAGIGYDHANWTFWSAPYVFADGNGTPIVSLSPRRYLQLKVDFLPRDEDGGQVDFLEVRASPPVATQLVGEIWPVEVKVGQPQQFTYAVRPTLGTSDEGFDRLVIATSSIVEGVAAVRIGDEPVSYVVEASEPHRVVVSFPRLTVKDSGALVEVVFRAQVLRYGSTFAAQVWDSAQPLEVPQGVQEGDASPAYEGNRVWVATTAREQAVLQVRAASVILTPNGDGRNDTVGLGYDLLELTGAALVGVAVWDLSGRLVRQVYAGRDDVGAYERMWDGRDASGRLVPPGLYLYRVSVEADHQTAEQAGLLHVVY